MTLPDPAPYFSVIIRCFNRRDRIVSSVDSVLGQTFQDFNVIVVDDASTDGSGELVSERFGADPRVSIVRHNENKGAAAAANTGVAQAMGQVIAFLDSDDSYLPDCLECHHATLEGAPDGMMTYCDYIQVWDTQGFERPLACGPDDQDQRLATLKGGFIHSQSLIAVRREVFERLGPFDEALQISHDFDLWMRMALDYEQPFRHIRRPLVKYALSTDGVTKRYERWWQEAKQVLARGRSHAAARPYLLELKDVDRQVGGNILARSAVEHWVTKGRAQHVSVVIAATSDAQTLEEAVRSVQQQTVWPGEFILAADQQNRDAILRITDDLTASGTPAVTLIGNFSRGEALVRCLNAAQGPLVAFLDPRDRWHPTYLQEQMHANSFPAEKPVFTYTDLLVTSDKDDVTDMPHEHHWPTSDLLEDHAQRPYPYSLSGMVVRSEIVPFLKLDDNGKDFSAAVLGRACLEALSSSPDKRRLGGSPLRIARPLVTVSAPQGAAGR